MEQGEFVELLSFLSREGTTGLNNYLDLYLVCTSLKITTEESVKKTQEAIENKIKLMSFQTGSMVNTTKSLRQILLQQNDIEKMKKLMFLEETGVEYNNVTEIQKDKAVRTGEETEEFVVVDTLKNMQLEIMNSGIKQSSKIDELGHLQEYIHPKIGKSQKMKRLGNKKLQLIKGLEDTVACALGMKEEQNKRIEALEKNLNALLNKIKANEANISEKDKRIEEQNKRIKVLENQMLGRDKRIKVLENQMLERGKRIKVLENQMSEKDKRIENLETEVQELVFQRKVDSADTCNLLTQQIRMSLTVRRLATAVVNVHTQDNQEIVKDTVEKKLEDLIEGKKVTFYDSDLDVMSKILKRSFLTKEEQRRYFKEKLMLE